MSFHGDKVWWNQEEIKWNKIKIGCSMGRLGGSDVYLILKSQAKNKKKKSVKVHKVMIFFFAVI